MGRTQGLSLFTSPKAPHSPRACIAWVAWYQRSLSPGPGIPRPQGKAREVQARWWVCDGLACTQETALCCSLIPGFLLLTPSRCERKDSCGWGEQGRLPGVCNFRPNLHTAGQMRIHLTDPKTLLEACCGGTPASGRWRQANVYVWSIWKILG